MLCRKIFNAYTWTEKMTISLAKSFNQTKPLQKHFNLAWFRTWQSTGIQSTISWKLLNGNHTTLRRDHALADADNTASVSRMWHFNPRLALYFPALTPQGFLYSFSGGLIGNYTVGFNLSMSSNPRFQPRCWRKLTVNLDACGRDL